MVESVLQTADSGMMTSLLCPYLLHQIKLESFVSVDSDGHQRATDFSDSFFL